MIQGLKTAKHSAAKNVMSKKKVSKNSDSVRAESVPVEEPKHAFYTEDDRMVRWRKSVFVSSSEIVPRFAGQQMEYNGKDITDEINFVNTVAKEFMQMGDLLNVMPNVVRCNVDSAYSTPVQQPFRMQSEKITTNEFADDTVTTDDSEDAKAAEGFEML